MFAHRILRCLYNGYSVTNFGMNSSMGSRIFSARIKLECSTIELYEVFYLLNICSIIHFQCSVVCAKYHSILRFQYNSFIHSFIFIYVFMTLSKCENPLKIACNSIEWKLFVRVMLSICRGMVNIRASVFNFENSFAIAWSTNEFHCFQYIYRFTWKLRLWIISWCKIELLDNFSDCCLKHSRVKECD